MKRSVSWIPACLIMAVLSFIIILYACNKDFNRQPSVVTDRVDKALSFAYGKIVDIGTGEISDYGFCWDTISITPDLGASTLRLGNRTNTGTFQGQLLGLRPSKSYHLRAFLKNSTGVIYGKLVDFTTPDLPVVTTSAVSEIVSTNAKCGGSVISDGGSPLTARGVCFSTTQLPDLNSVHTIDSSGTGEFISSLTGLTPDAKYYVRAYATSIYGTTYGGEVSFTAGQNITLPVITTAGVTSITPTTAQCGGEVISEGGAAVTERGVCYGVSALPVISGPKTSDGSGTGIFFSSIAGLTANTLYYVRSYATSSAGTAYGNEVTFTTLTNPVLPTLTTTAATNITQTTATSGGNITSDGGAPVTERGVCWSTSSNPTTANSHTINGSGTGSFASDLTGLNANTLYYVRSYATNSAGAAYGNEVTFTTSTSPVLPTLTTTAATNITQTTATSGGNVTSGGGATITARGVCWSISHNPTIANSHTSDGSGTGSFISSITGLSAGTNYYVRAYATNSAGTAYGNEVIFTTSSVTFYIGQNYGGGIIFYIDGTSQHGLIATINDQSTGAEWGCIGTNISGTSTAIGTGQANTTNIVNGCNTAGIAARICNDLVLNGYSDWFLPSKDELNQIYINKDIIGGFANDYYWSSSELNDLNAWAQKLDFGAQYGYQKTWLRRVRAIRAF